jgi:hypothetical protein
MATQLFATVRAKTPLTHEQRQALLSHWSPRVAKAIARSLYPDFRGTYEQHLWLLTLKAAEGTGNTGSGTYNLYVQESREKGILFLLPVKRIEDVRLCGPSHYLYYILNWEREQVNALLSPEMRRSPRLLKKYLIDAVLAFHAYRDLCYEAKPGIKGKQERRRALNTSVNKQMMLGSGLVYFQQLAYGWKHLTTAVGGSRPILEMDTSIQARR